MHEKKIRGMKRKTNTMIKRIEEHTKIFPSTFYNDEYWYMPLPVSQAFIESHKIPRKVKRLCIQTLIDRVNHLIKIKPSDTHTYRVVTLISIENLWESQIIVFKNDDYFHNFFNRNNEFQRWISLSNEKLPFFHLMKSLYNEFIIYYIGGFQVVIPKYPDVPTLTKKQIDQITEIVFLKEITTQKCDAIFVFGGSHPGNWQAPLEAYRQGLGNQIIVTGGTSLHGMKHPSWNYGDLSDAEVIVTKLMEHGVPKDAILFEKNSLHSIANVMEAKKIFDFTKINQLLFVCKSLGAGRQYRVLKKHLPKTITCIPYTFDTSFDGEFTINRYNWMENEKSRSMIFGEYLRNVCYGRKGGIEPPEKEVHGLEEYVSYYYNLA